jgi:hypothetical protein
MGNSRLARTTVEATPKVAGGPQSSLQLSSACHVSVTSGVFGVLGVRVLLIMYNIVSRSLGRVVGSMDTVGSGCNIRVDTWLHTSYDGDQSTWRMQL